MIKLDKARRLFAVACVLVSACSRQHVGPESSDTVTNWLHRCAANRDCRGEASCVASLCTLTCDVREDDACGLVSADSICDTTHNSCDVPCGVAMTCEALGRGYTCRAGHCRLEADPIAETSDKRGQDALTTKEAEWKPLATSAESEGRADLVGEYLLGRGALGRPGPFVDWTGEHARVSWEASGFDDPQTQLGSADVFLDGRLATRTSTVQATVIASELTAHAGTVLHIENRRRDHETCALAATDLNTGVSTDSWSFTCGAQAEVAPIPGTGDWLVVWAEGNSPPPGPAPIHIARYRPGIEGWVEGPWTVPGMGALVGPGSIALVNGDVWISMFQNAVVRANGVLDGTPPRAGAVESDVFSSDDDPGTREYVVPMAERVLFMRHYSRGTSFASAGDDGVLSPWKNVEHRGLHVLGERKLIPIPERNSFALCLATDLGVFVTVLDALGVPTIGELPVDTTGLALDCDLTWSGQQIFVAWSRPSADQTALTYHGRFVALP